MGLSNCGSTLPHQTSDFLHHNRIVHLDFLPQHIGMNAVMKYSEMLHSMGMWDPEEVRYALFDFGAFIAFPEDAVIEETLTTHYLSFDLYDVPEKSVKYPYNPFKANIAFLGTYLQRRIRVGLLRLMKQNFFILIILFL